MEQIIYQQSPYVLLVYPQTLQVYDTQHWQGWVRQPAGTGHRQQLLEVPHRGPQRGRRRELRRQSGWTAVLAGALVVLAALAIWWALRRRRKPAVEETP